MGERDRKGPRTQNPGQPRTQDPTRPTVDGGKFASEIAFLCRKSVLRDPQGIFKGPTRNLQGIAYIP